MYSKDWPAQCVVVIPSLNEAGTIGSLVRQVRSQLPFVIVVDDGSTDETGKLAEAAGAEVVRHETTRGKGAALASGWQRAQARGFLWALDMDGDGQHSPADIPAILARAGQSEAALVVGNRMAGPSEALSQLKLRSHHFTVESEMMLAFAAAGHRIDFVPVEVIYEGERSRIRPLKDTWRWLRWLARRPSRF